MISQLKKIFASKAIKSFDPSVFNHPLALKTDWSPLASGGANFKTKTLKKISSSEIRFVISNWAKAFLAFFAIFPLFFMVSVIFSLITDEFEYEMLLFLFIPLIFLGVALFLLKNMVKEIVFDKQSGYFYKGKKKVSSSLNPEKEESTFNLFRIHAIQIIPENIKGKNSSYTSYEINLVLDDGSRTHVIDHGHKDSIEADAVTLSEFLHIPVWNSHNSTAHIPKNIQQTDSYDSSKKSINKRYSSSSTQDLDEDYDSTKPRNM